MEYVKVESSQLAEVGFGDGVYGPETLAIIFHPTKKQAAAGEPGSTYHYGNVSTRTHQALMAAPSIGSYFGSTIKNQPLLYPFTKVESENPPQPAPKPVNGIAGELFAEPAPSTALAVIDTMADDLLFTANAVTDAQLEAGRTWYLAEAKKYDISTEEKRMELKRFARPLQKLRTGIEARAKELTGATKRKIAAIDAEKRRLVQIVGGIEDEVLRPLTEWESEEETRKIRLSGICTQLAQYGQSIYPDVRSLEVAIGILEGFDLSAMHEYRIGAESAIAASLKVLKPELARRKVAEANEAELNKLRADAAARDAQARIDFAAQQAREQAERDSREQVAAMEAEVLAATERAEKAAAQAKIDQEAAVEAERKRAADAAAKEYAAMEARAADEANRLKVQTAIVDALLDECQIDQPAAEVVLNAIVKGIIPHVTVNY